MKDYYNKGSYNKESIREQGLFGELDLIHGDFSTVMRFIILHQQDMNDGLFYATIGLDANGKPLSQDEREIKQKTVNETLATQVKEALANGQKGASVENLVKINKSLMDGADIYYIDPETNKSILTLAWDIEPKINGQLAQPIMTEALSKINEGFFAKLSKFRFKETTSKLKV